MKLQYFGFWKSAVAGLIMLLSPIPASADLMLTAGAGGGNAGTDNVLFNCSGAISGPATTVQGCLNNSNSTLVNFTSDGTVNLVTPAMGAARIEGENSAGFSAIEIALDDTTLGFSKLIFNLDAAANGTATFLAIDQFGNPFDFSFDLVGSGQNFFTLDSANNQVAVSFKLVSTVPIKNISDLEQVRLGPTERCTQDCTATTATQATEQVPEPSTMFLLGSGLFVLARAARKTRK